MLGVAVMSVPRIPEIACLASSETDKPDGADSDANGLSPVVSLKDAARPVVVLEQFDAP